MLTKSLAVYTSTGSGVLRHMDRITSRLDEVDVKRIKKLSNVQLSILKKAVTFPNVNTIVYSTCSIHEVENEDVVARFLAEYRQEGWGVDYPCRFNEWCRRGRKHVNLSPEESRALIRCDGEDEMNGFFVALLRKKTSSKLITNASTTAGNVHRLNTRGKRTRSFSPGDAFKLKTKKLMTFWRPFSGISRYYY